MRPAQRVRAANSQIEQGVHKAVCQYIRVQYPKAPFRTDGAGLWLSKTQAGIYASMQYKPGWPDLFIAYPMRHTFDDGHTVQYAGLFIELKKDGTVLKRPKDGKFVVKGDYKIRKAGDWYDRHIEEQADMLRQLNSLGYLARFAVGFDKARKIIDWYMDIKKELPLGDQF